MRAGVGEYLANHGTSKKTPTLNRMGATARCGAPGARYCGAEVDLSGTLTVALVGQSTTNRFTPPSQDCALRPNSRSAFLPRVSHSPPWNFRPSNSSAIRDAPTKTPSSGTWPLLFRYRNCKDCRSPHCSYHVAYLTDRMPQRLGQYGHVELLLVTDDRAHGAQDVSVECITDGRQMSPQISRSQ